MSLQANMPSSHFVKPVVQSPLGAGLQPPKFSHPLVASAVKTLAGTLAEYLSAEQIDHVLEACAFADRAHINDTRKSGEPYVTHPIAVADILGSYHMDVAAIIAAILHDTVEDTEVTEEDVLAEFGHTVKLLVDGVTKLNISQNKQLNKAATFRKILTATLSDSRVIIIKLADRLHNMSTMGAVRTEKRIATASETLEFYLPFARVMGLNELADNLELLCLKNLDEKQFEFFAKKYNDHKLVRSFRQRQIEQYFYRKMGELGLKGRVKIEDNYVDLCRTFFKNKAHLDTLLTQYKFSAIFTQVTCCDAFANYIKQRYRISSDNIKDHIRKPYPGGQQALLLHYKHDNETIDLAIQTETMRQVTRLGAMLGEDAPEVSRTLLKASLKNLQELVNPTCAASTSHALLDYLNQDKILIYTPDNDIFELPRGATVLDFAYAVSPFLGNHAIAAQVDGSHAKLATKLTTGQRVFIVTDPLSAPNAEWLSFVVTTKARHNLQSWLKEQSAPEQIQGGKDALNRALRAYGSHTNTLSNDEWQSILGWQMTDDKSQIYQRIATGALLPQLVVSRLFSAKPNQSIQDTALIKNTQGIELHFANCCNPIQGDPIAGHLTRKGMVVHRHRCFTIVDALKTHPQQVLELNWQENVKSKRVFGVHLVIAKVVDDDAISQLILALHELDAGVNDIYTQGDETLMYLEVKDRKHVAKIIRDMRAMLDYPSVRRMYQFS